MRFPESLINSRIFAYSLPRCFSQSRQFTFKTGATFGVASTASWSYLVTYAKASSGACRKKENNDPECSSSAASCSGVSSGDSNAITGVPNGDTTCANPAELSLSTIKHSGFRVSGKRSPGYRMLPAFSWCSNAVFAAATLSAACNLAAVVAAPPPPPPPPPPLGRAEPLVAARFVLAVPSKTRPARR